MATMSHREPLLLKKPQISEWDKQLMMRFTPATEKWDFYSSSRGTAKARRIYGRKGEVWTPESAIRKFVVYCDR